jgi:hypothetical protein
MGLFQGDRLTECKPETDQQIIPHTVANIEIPEIHQVTKSGGRILLYGSDNGDNLMQIFATIENL